MAAHASVLLMALEDFLSAPEAQRPDARARLLAALRAALADGCWEEAALTLRRALVPTLDYTTAQSLYRVYRQLRPQLPDPGVPLKLALLSNVTSDPLAQFRLFLFANGVAVELCGLTTVSSGEILDGLRPLRVPAAYHFLATTWRDRGATGLRRRGGQARVGGSGGWALWRLAHERLGCRCRTSMPHPGARSPAADAPSGFGSCRGGERLPCVPPPTSPPTWTTWRPPPDDGPGRTLFYHAKLPCAPVPGGLRAQRASVAAHWGWRASAWC